LSQDSGANTIKFSRYIQLSILHQKICDGSHRFIVASLTRLTDI